MWRWVARARAQAEPPRRGRFEIDDRLRVRPAYHRGNATALHRELVAEQRPDRPAPSVETVQRAVRRDLTAGERAGLRRGERERRKFDVFLERPPSYRNAAWEADHVEAPVEVEVDGRLVKPWDNAARSLTIASAIFPEFSPRSVPASSPTLSAMSAMSWAALALRWISNPHHFAWGLTTHPPDANRSWIARAAACCSCDSAASCSSVWRRASSNASSAVCRVSHRLSVEDHQSEVAQVCKSKINDGSPAYTRAIPHPAGPPPARPPRALSRTDPDRTPAPARPTATGLSGQNPFLREVGTTTGRWKTTVLRSRLTDPGRRYHAERYPP